LRFGVGIPNCREGLYFPPCFASPREIIHIAQTAEEVGFDSVWVNDHYTPPTYVKALWDRPPNFYEPLITLATLASVTETVRLAIGVAVMPVRNPVILAKQAATLDVFSEGRFILAIGLGAYREEFEKVHPALASVSRKALLEEGVDAVKALLTQPCASYHGRHVRFHEIELFPKPVQDPFPIYMGGNAEDVVRRAGAIGDGWLAAGLTPEELARGRALIEKTAVEHGRNPAAIDIAPQYAVSIAQTHEDAVAQYKSTALYHHRQSLQTATYRGLDIQRLEERNLIGTPHEILERLDQLARVGVTHPAALIFASKTVEEMIGAMTLFATEVIPSVA
jgi:probable F420-dependent oxidoreductase